MNYELAIHECPALQYVHLLKFTHTEIAMSNCAAADCGNICYAKLCG
jgi:hypothetical protein